MPQKKSHRVWLAYSPNQGQRSTALTDAGVKCELLKQLKVTFKSSPPLKIEQWSANPATNPATAPNQADKQVKSSLQKKRPTGYFAEFAIRCTQEEYEKLINPKNWDETPFTLKTLTVDFEADKHKIKPLETLIPCLLGWGLFAVEKLNLIPGLSSPLGTGIYLGIGALVFMIMAVCGRHFLRSMHQEWWPESNPENAAKGNDAAGLLQDASATNNQHDEQATISSSSQLAPPEDTTATDAKAPPFHRHFGLNSFIVLTVFSGWLVSFAMLIQPSFFATLGLQPFFSATLAIITLMKAGEWIDQYQHNKVLRRSYHGINQLIYQLLPHKITRESSDEQGAEETVELDDVRVFDTLRIDPNQIIPVACTIIPPPSDKAKKADDTMTWSISNTAETGEPKPKKMRIGQALKGRYINKSQHPLWVQTNQAGKNSSIAITRDAILANPDHAQKHAPQARAYQYATYVFLLLLIFGMLITALAWTFWGPAPGLEYAFSACLAVLFCACPVTLSIAQDAPIHASRIALDEASILIRQTGTLKTLNEIKAIAFDKTGTLTDDDSLRVQNCELNSEGHDLPPKADIYAALYQLQAGFPTNNYAQATLRYLDEQEIARGQIEHFKILPDNKTTRGLSCQWRAADGVHTLRIGTDDFLTTHYVSTPSSSSPQEYTTSYIAVDGHYVGLLSFDSDLKPSTVKAILALKERKIPVYMITGDNETVAKRIAREVHIDEDKVYFDIKKGTPPNDLTNEQKLEDKDLLGKGLKTGFTSGKYGVIQALKKKYGQVMFVGDNANDEYALQAATVGVSIRADTCVASHADIWLNDEPEGVPRLVHTAQYARQSVRFNLVILLFINALSIATAGGLLYALWGIFLLPAETALLGSAFSGLAMLTMSCQMWRLKRQIKASKLDFGTALSHNTTAPSVVTTNDLHDSEISLGLPEDTKPSASAIPADQTMRSIRQSGRKGYCGNANTPVAVLETGLLN